MPGEHQDRLLAAHPLGVLRLRDRLMDLQTEAEGEAGQAEESAEEAAQQHQVQLLRTRAPQATGEAQPQGQTGQHADGLTHQVGDAEQPQSRQPPTHVAPPYGDQDQRA